MKGCAGRGYLFLDFVRTHLEAFGYISYIYYRWRKVLQNGRGYRKEGREFQGRFFGHPSFSSCLRRIRAIWWIVFGKNWPRLGGGWRSRLGVIVGEGEGAGNERYIYRPRAKLLSSSTPCEAKVSCDSFFYSVKREAHRHPRFESIL